VVFAHSPLATHPQMCVAESQVAPNSESEQSASALQPQTLDVRQVTP
jgi:hypothetical protein